jgi:shikimate dehydrogenase
MVPEVDETPIALDALDPSTVVMDAIYHPRETRLLREARRAGCPTIDGVDMFVAQGALQFTWWTGKQAPEAAMRSAVIGALEGRERPIRRTKTP